jgi:preprotein translocase subunit YajC
MEQLIQYLSILSATEWFMLSVAIVLLMSLFTFKRQRKLHQEQTLSMQMLQRDLRALANAAVGVGGRVLEIERQQRKQKPVVVQVQEETQKQPVSAPVEFYNPNNTPYEQAIRMAQTGASVDDIVNVCGLSKSEAELVTMMHRLDKAS